MTSPYSEPAPATGAPGGKTSFMGLDSNVGAMLCYIANFLCCLGLVLAIIFLFTEKENRFVKYNAVQYLYMIAMQLVTGIDVSSHTALFSLVVNRIHMELLAWLLVLWFRFIVFLIFLIMWVIGGIKAYGGQWYQLPIIGQLAWKTVNQ